MIILGIDPGVNGACALYKQPDCEGVISRDARIKVFDLPTSGEGTKRRLEVSVLKSWIEDHPIDYAFIELVNAMPLLPGKDDESGERGKIGATSMFRFGMAYGMLQATILCCGLPLEYVTPQKWKKHFDLKGGAENKDMSRQKVLNLFPNYAALFQRKLDHQRAEALLIAVYGMSYLAKKRNGD